MFDKFFDRLFNGSNEKEIKKIRKIVEQQINPLEDGLKKLSDSSLANKTNEFKARLAKGETLDDILPEAFAVIREASRRVLGMRHFDTQLIGGIILHRGNIAEMCTGEGKTLVATAPVYLNALEGKGVHVITVNDYLAKRDSEWMGQVYKFLGLSVGLIIHDLDFNQRKIAYNSDITYGTNNEFGFDYLRDNMVTSLDQMVQRPLHYCLIDEVDSILIDEARTPLIISGPGQKSTDAYYTVAKLVPQLKKEEDYTIDEKQKTVAPTEAGVAKMEKLLHVENLYDAENLELNHLFVQALRAQTMMTRDKDYVVKDGEVVIVDEFTGRLMYGRRYSDGLHQAIEAKEGLEVQRESQTLATITFQNYFRMYDKLAGMTGTAKTEEQEFIKIYGLPVLQVPTNKPIQRKDLPDVIFKNKRGKYKAVVREVERRHATGQPMLIGTTSIEQSEELSHMLDQANIPHSVLNAKYHEREAAIVALAGQKGAVTIATNMAGRGTDIKLGPGVVTLPPEVVKSNLSLKDKLPGTNQTVGDALLAVHRSFLKPVGRLLDNKIKINGMAHITGGGFPDNIPRVLPKAVACEIDRTAWDVPTIFKFIERQGKVDHDEMYRVFNMGIGFVLIVPKTSLPRIKTVFRNMRQTWHQIGVIRVRKTGMEPVFYSK